MSWNIRRLLPGHGWHTRPGCRTIVLDRGAVQFDYPRSWIVVPSTDSVAICDREPPANQSRLEVSFLRLPLPEYEELPPAADLVDRVTSPARDNATNGPLREEIRHGIEVAWRDIFLGSTPRRPDGLFRVGIARRGAIHCLITYEWLGGHQARRDDVWEEVLDTLVLDRSISDPARGPAPGAT
jgi:hypothetical protein